MTKSEFIASLKQALAGMVQTEKDDILYDYEEHFSIGLEKGKTEAEISDALGDPKAIAKQYKASMMVKKAEESKTIGNIARAIIATLGLGLFNLIFMLGPFIGVLGVLVGLFAASLAVSTVGIAAFTVMLIPEINPIPWATALPLGVGGLFAIGVTCLGLLMLIGTFYLAKLFYSLTISYLKMNIKIIAK